MKEDNYNGWTNYETWNAALWLGNEEGSSSYCDDLAQEAYDEAKKDNTFTRMEKAAFDLSDRLRYMFESDNRLPSSGWIADAVNSYISSVNWYEIAKSYLDNVQEEVEEETKTDKLIKGNNKNE